MFFDRYTKYFLIGFVGATILLVALLYVLVTFGVEAPSAASVGALVASVVYPATKYAQNENKIPPNGLSWQYAFIWSGYALLLGVIMVGLTNIAGAPSFPSVPLAYWILIVAVAYIVQVFVFRFSFPFFVKLQLKAIEKQKQK